jgi:hypothetical protein
MTVTPLQRPPPRECGLLQEFGLRSAWSIDPDDRLAPTASHQSLTPIVGRPITPA